MTPSRLAAGSTSLRAASCRAGPANMGTAFCASAAPSFSGEGTRPNTTCPTGLASSATRAASCPMATTTAAVLAARPASAGSASDRLFTGTPTAWVKASSSAL